MAEPTTISQVLPAPVLEGSLTAFLKSLDPLMGQQIQTGTYAPQIAAESALQQQARTAAGGLGSLVGPQAYQQFMSPYQQEVIDTSLAEFDKQRQLAQNQISQQAITSGAFGGGREGVQLGEFGAQSLQDRSLLEAQLRAQGFGQAQQAAAQAQAQQVGLASLQPSLAQSQIQQLGATGTADLGYQQAVLDAAAQGQQMSAYEPYNRLQFLGSSIGGMLSGQPQAYSTMTQAPAAATAGPLGQAISGAATIYGLGSLFGR